MSKELMIDPEFRDLIPRLRPEEHKGLEKSLVNEGCRDDIVTWRDIVIDGTNRLEICSRLNIPFETREMDFKNREEVMKWIINNQLARRNLTDERRRYLMGKRLQQEVKPVGAPKGHEGANQHIKANGVKVTTLAAKRTTGKIAKELKVSPKTVQNSSTYASAVDLIGKVSPGAKEAILDKKLPTTQKDVVKLAKLPADKIKDIIDKASEGEKVGDGIKEEEQRKQDEKTVTLEKATTKDRVYQVIYADPLWEQRVLEWRDDYFKDMQGLCEINPPADTNCVLFIWCPPHLIESALKVIHAWGFKFQTSAVWISKPKLIDCFFRQKHELLLMGIKGDIKAESSIKKRPLSVIKARQEKDCRKPQIVGEQIELMYPKLNKLAIFPGGVQREGWDIYAFNSTSNKYEVIKNEENSYEKNCK
ncbi:MAG: hypothetical protein HQK96_21195 [Nitrospirae bacterium]|nr:hypothetical protein [Nitrospirota bacterium]